MLALIAARKQNNIDEAFQHYELLKDSLFQIQQTKTINELRIQHQLEHQNQIVKEHKSEIKTCILRNTLITIIGLVFFLLAGVIFLFYRKLHRSYKDIFIRNKELSSSIERAETCFKTFELSSSRDNSSNGEALWQKIRHILITEKAYTQPQFCLDDLTNRCESNKTYVSNAIKKYAQTNFNRLINQMRVEEAKKDH